MLDLAGEWLRQLGDWGTDHRFALMNAGLLLVAGWIAARWAVGRVHALGKHFGQVDAPYRPIVADLVRYAILSPVVVAVLSFVGVPTLGPIVLFVAFALVTALTLQGTLRNLTAGAMIHAVRPLKVGDLVETDGVTGTVTEIGLIATNLRTDDGVFVSIPNSRLSSRVVRNFSRLGSRRLEVTVTIGYDQDIDEVLALCRDLAEANGRVLRDPPPEVVVSSLRDTAVAITLRAWTSSAAHADALFQLNREIKKALDAADVHMAPTAPRLPTPPIEPASYVSTPFRARVRSRAIEP